MAINHGKSEKYFLLPFLFGLTILLSSCGGTEKAENPVKVRSVKDTCSYLNAFLQSDQKTIEDEEIDWKSISKRLAKDDPAYAEALADYPELSYGILLGDNWDRHALRMIDLYHQSAKLAYMDQDLEETLNDSAFVWMKCLRLHQTPPGALKGKLDEEQIALDTREGNINRKFIRATCNISAQLLP